MASDNDPLNYSIAQPGKSSFKKLDKLIEEGSAGTKKKKEKMNGKMINDIDTSVSVSGRWPCGWL